MAEFFVCYGLELKAFLKKRICYISLITFALVILISLGIRLPNSSNLTIGLIIPKGEEFASYKDKLLSYEGDFSFEIFDKEEELEELVKNGTCECGFVFSKDFCKKLENRKLSKLVTYIYSPYTLKGYVVKEVVFSIILEEYGKNILEDGFLEAFDSSNTEAFDELLLKYDNYKRGDEVFSFNYKREGKKDDLKNKEAGKPAIILYFVLLLLEAVTCVSYFYSLRKNTIISFLEPKKKIKYLVSGSLSVLTPIALAALILWPFLV